MLTTLHTFWVWVTSTLVGKIVASGFISMLPLVELRAGIPIAVGLGLEPRIAILTCIVANIIPIPFIILFIRKIFAVVRKWSATFEKLISKVEAKAYKHRDMIDKYAAMGLFILTAIPLPGTGAWTGTLAASILDMKFKDVLIACMGGVLLAGIIMGLASAGLLGALSGLFAAG